MNLIGNVHKYPLVLSVDASPGSIGLEKLLSDAILRSDFLIFFENENFCRRNVDKFKSFSFAPFQQFVGWKRKQKS